MKTLHCMILACAALACAAITASAVTAQSISISPNTLEADVANTLLTPHSFYLAGPQTYGLEGVENTFHEMDAAGKYLLSLTALRLVSEDALALDVPLHVYIPDIIEDIPFKRPITLRHLLTETAGFAVPAAYNPSLPLQRYGTQVRTAGYAPHHDRVGWSIVSKLLERMGGMPLPSVIVEKVLSPLGVQAAALQFTGGDPLDPQATLRAKPVLFAAIFRITVWNQTTDGERFLPKDLQRELTEFSSWQFHPKGPARTLGLTLQNTTPYPTLELYPSPDTSGPFFRAYPKSGMVFISLKTPSPRYKEIVDSVAEQYFLPSPVAQHQKLIQYEPMSGLYVRSDTPSLSLHKRLNALQSGTIKIEEHTSGILSMYSTDPMPQHLASYRKKQPFYFEGITGETAIFSAYKQGGYLMLEGKLYHYVGPLGDKKLVIDMLPVAFFLLLSSVVYLRKNYSKSWHNMARITLLGTCLAGLGITAEYYLWETATYSWDSGWLITLWRLILNIGLALVLSHPLFTLSFTRGRKMPTTGFGIVLVPLHMGLITIAAVGLFLMMVAWGIVGTL